MANETLLKRVLRALGNQESPSRNMPRLTAERAVLNVGGNSKSIALPGIYKGWDQIWLDIDPAVKPDVLCDARELLSTPAGIYDAVYCSHNLEHYYRHDGRKVLAGFVHVLKPGGFAHIRVPDLEQVMQRMRDRQLDVDDVLYESGIGPITVHDVLYGYGKELEESGNDFFAHKAGFTPKALLAFLREAGFSRIYIGTAELEIVAYAFMNAPSPELVGLLGLPAD